MCTILTKTVAVCQMTKPKENESRRKKENGHLMNNLFFIFKYNTELNVKKSKIRRNQAQCLCIRSSIAWASVQRRIWTMNGESVEKKGDVTMKVSSEQ